MTTPPLKAARLLGEWAFPEESPLARAITRHQASGRRMINLATASVGTHGIAFDEGLLRKAADGASQSLAIYAPDCRGDLRLREAIARYHQDRGGQVDPTHILIGPGTSLLYFHAFRLLAGFGGEVLVPSPGYPLFDDLATIAGCTTRRYHMGRQDNRWVVDPGEIAFQITPSTRAICVVSPHNPTGHCWKREEWEGLAEVARKAGIAVISDEVFSEFTAPGTVMCAPPQDAFPLLLRLNGLSKMLFLPGLKVAWMSIHGDDATRDKFLGALDRLNDAFLPVSDPATAIAINIMTLHATTEVERLRGEVDHRRQIAQECLGNLANSTEAGVYLTIPTRITSPLEDTCITLLEEANVLVHPGEFYDLPGHLVMCFLEQPDRLAEGCMALRDFMTGAGLSVGV
jgi:alanine-synthesizing transaminase